jgi:hypothetical protein
MSHQMTNDDWPEGRRSPIRKEANAQGLSEPERSTSRRSTDVSERHPYLFNIARGAVDPPCSAILVTQRA